MSETDEDIPWADPPQSTPETGRPDLPCQLRRRRIPPPPETAQTGEHLEGLQPEPGGDSHNLFLRYPAGRYPAGCRHAVYPAGFHRNTGGSADAKQVEVNGKSCTAFPCQVAAKQLTDDIEARMVVNGKYGPVYTYTVKDYLNYLLEHDYPQQAKELAGTCWCMAAKRSCTLATGPMR